MRGPPNRVHLTIPMNSPVRQPLCAFLGGVVAQEARSLPYISTFILIQAKHPTTKHKHATTQAKHPRESDPQGLSL